MRPLPFAYFGHVLAIAMNVMRVLDELVAHALLEMRSLIRPL